MTKNKLMIVAFVLSLLVIPMIFAAGTATLNTPVTRTNYTTLTWNCTSTVTSAATKYNVTIFYNATGGAASNAATKLGSTVWNTTGSNTEFTASPSIESLSDLLTYNFTCYADNGTDKVYSTGIKSVGIDNTEPVTTLIVKSPTMSTSRTQELTWTSSDATSGLTSTTVTVAKPSSSCASESWTTAAGTSQQVVDSSCDGTYTVTLTATDTAGNVKTSTATYKATYPGAKRGGASTLSSGIGNIGSGIGSQGIGSDNGTVVVVAIALICLLWLYNRRK